MNWIYVLVGVALVAALFEPVRKALKKSGGKEEPKTESSGLPYPCVIEGSTDMSPMEARVNALAIEASSKGIVITGDYAVDVKNQGGEMTLCGQGFKFVFDANGQIVQSESRCNLFAVDYKCEGGMNPDGSLGVSVDVGGAKVGVEGRVVNGNFIGGKVIKGWLPHIWGVLNGSYRKV